ncbi:MAG: hypothetical protein ACKO81_14090 [Planctomycetota bacterium]
MKLTSITAALLAVSIASPWLFCQEPAPVASSPLAASQTPAENAAKALLAAPAQANPYAEGAAPFGSSGMIANWERENGQWVIKYRPIGLAETEFAFNEAYQAYQSATDDAARTKATADLKSNLEKQYDLFVEGQSKQIEELEARLAKLKGQLDKRRAAKERVVELKLQMVLSQAEGLGFPESGSSIQSVISREQLQRYSDPPIISPNASYPGDPVPSSISPAAPNKLVAPQSLPRVEMLPPAAAPAPTPPRAEDGDQNKID